jgi:hypothetical protein
MCMCVFCKITPYRSCMACVNDNCLKIILLYDRKKTSFLNNNMYISTLTTVSIQINITPTWPNLRTEPFYITITYSTCNFSALKALNKSEVYFPFCSVHNCSSQAPDIVFFLPTFRYWLFCLWCKAVRQRSSA